VRIKKTAPMHDIRAAGVSASLEVSARRALGREESMCTALSVGADLIHHESDHRFVEPQDIPGEIPGFREEEFVYSETAHFRTEACYLAVHTPGEHSRRYLYLDLVLRVNQSINALLLYEYQLRDHSAKGGEKKQRKCVSLLIRFASGRHEMR
jgi:hypothetical protein